VAGKVQPLNSVSEAVLGALRDRRWPIITSYELFRLVWEVYSFPERFPIKIRKRVSSPGWLQYNRVITELSSERFIRPDPDLDGGQETGTLTKVFRVSEIPDSDAEDIICLYDPFASISYLSAMQRYSITVRQPKSLYITSLEARLWRKEAYNKTKDDFGFDPSEVDLAFFRTLSFTEIPDRLRDRSITVKRTIHPFRSQSITDGFGRIIQIGDLFVQMLHSPDLCGGMAHVLEIWENHSDTYRNEIIESVNRIDSSIIKVRAGYIMSELCEIDDDRIQIWKKFAQRGGSRKLDPSAPYEPVYSEDWMISLNA
jgi:predicted transcriptional regulator of viral defense system